MKTFVTSYGFGLDAVAASCSTEPWPSDLNRWPRLVNSIANGQNRLQRKTVCCGDCSRSRSIPYHVNTCADTLRNDGLNMFDCQCHIVALVCIVIKLNQYVYTINTSSIL
jgi:hypothetical protein